MNRLSSTIRLLLLFILACLILLFFYVGLYLPKEDRLILLAKDLSIIEKNITSLRNQQKEISLEIDRKQTETPSFPAEFLSASPSSDDTPELLSQWTKEGEKMGIEFLLFKPLEEKIWAPLIEMPIEITLRGTFHQTLQFFDYLSKLERKILISNIEMSQPERKENIYVVSTHAIATTFRKKGGNP